MNTTDLMHKRPIVAPQTDVSYRWRVARRYGNPLPEMAFAAGMLAGLVAVDRVGAAAAILWIVH